MQIEELYQIFLQYPSVQTDTRKIIKGDIFFALKGTHFNGNNFAQEALNLGAAYVVADEPISIASERIIYVSDVLHSLQLLAKHHRQQLHIPLIAITGSNGKTTTKELLHQVLSTSFKTYTTSGNLNNHIGIPLTLLKIKADAQIAVIEMGANHQKEIESYCSFTLPTHGVITNCGKAHLQGFGGEEGVRKGKGELFDYLKATQGTAFIMADYNYLQKMSAGIATIKTYGTHDAEVVGNITSSSIFLEIALTKGVIADNIKTHLVGEYNLPNLLAAAAVAKYFNVPDNKIKQALESYIPSNSRSQLLQIGSNKIILDAYNANPSSMKLAIENFAKMAGNNKILMLGAMMELGQESLKEHQALINIIEQYNWAAVILVGGDFENLTHHYLYLENALLAGKWYRQQQLENAQILIKGSRSMQMEKLLD